MNSVEHERLRERDVDTFHKLLRIAEEGDLVLLSCEDRGTGAYRAVVCAHYEDEAGQTHLVPLAKLFDGDAHEEIREPFGEIMVAS